MYGTVARLRVKPGMAGALQQRMAAYQALKVSGHVGEYVYQMDTDPNEYYLAVLFESKAAYQANAQDPAQDQRYQQMRALLVEDPEWHDGEVVQARS